MSQYIIEKWNESANANEKSRNLWLARKEGVHIDEIHRENYISLRKKFGENDEY